jgi:hypothetical protein
MRTQMVINPACEDACLHRRCARLRKRLHPAIQLRTSRWNRSFPLNLPAHILYAIADRLLVNVAPNINTYVC